MGKISRQELMGALNDSLTVIRGSAQMASTVDHPRWSARYIRQIIDQIDKTSVLLRQVEELYQMEQATATATEYTGASYYH